jgi:hypothetical protein
MMAGIIRGKRAVTGNLNIQLKKGTVTVAGKPSDDLDKGTQRSILKQASLI